MSLRSDHFLELCVNRGCQAVNLSTCQGVKLNFDDLQLAAPRAVAPRDAFGQRKDPPSSRRGAVAERSRSRASRWLFEKSFQNFAEIRTRYNAEPASHGRDPPVVGTHLNRSKGWANNSRAWTVGSRNGIEVHFDAKNEILVLRKLFPDTRPEIPSPAGSPV
jgi:hypothetical protein